MIMTHLLISHSLTSSQDLPGRRGDMRYSDAANAVQLGRCNINPNNVSITSHMVVALINQSIVVPHLNVCSNLCLYV